MKYSKKNNSQEMLEFNTVESRLREIFSANPDIIFALLFGSSVTGNTTELSDLDLAVYVRDPRTFSFYDKLGLHGECCRVLHRNDIDLIVLNQTENIILLDEVMRNGKIIYSIDDETVDNFSVKTLHRAIDFREHRKRSMGI